MARPSEPRIELGGPPAVTAGMVGTGSVQLSVDDDAVAAGARVQEAVDAAVRELPNDSAVRRLGRLAQEYPHIVLRTPSFFEGMNHLVRHRYDSAIRRIIGEARRGRRHESQFYLVSLVDQVREAENCSVSEASRRVFERHRRELAKSARSIENDYGRYKDDYDMWASSKYVSGERLTTQAWRESDR